ncbi:hypothetical protein ACFQ1M_01220 [Sungkyunkwania multivorans]|uniref:Uncharacterized protein n=1 Tax=Sungkyunkwania multivorans TaxID=1173618 RepID=A0ABW3CUV7_9FLAO
MFKALILSFFSLATVSTGVGSSETKEEPVCRVTCTINVPDGFGGSIGVSGTAGNFLTSCETARERACRRAAENAMAILMDAQ